MATTQFLLTGPVPDILLVGAVTSAETKGVASGERK